MKVFLNGSLPLLLLSPRRYFIVAGNLQVEFKFNEPLTVFVPVVLLFTLTDQMCNLKICMLLLGNLICSVSRYQASREANLPNCICCVKLVPRRQPTCIVCLPTSHCHEAALYLVTINVVYRFIFFPHERYSPSLRDSFSIPRRCY